MNGIKIILILAFFALPLANGTAEGLRHITVYVQNPTSGTIHYAYRQGGDDWVMYELQTGHTKTYTGIAPHTICVYDSHGGKQVYNLSDDETYYFVWQNKYLNLLHR